MSEAIAPTTYATLLNGKIMMPLTSDQYCSIEKNFLVECIDLYLRSVSVDSAWYLKEYPDIQMAIKSGVFSSAGEHYRRFGYYEHRKPYEIIVDETWYLEAYPDVKSAIEARHFSSGQKHFDAVGFREGRLPFANFALQVSRGNE